MLYRKNSWKKITVSAIVPLLTLSLMGTTVDANGTSKTEDQAISTSTSISQSTSSGQFQSPDPDKVKFTKEEAINKIRVLMPVLKKADVDRVELGVTNQYPLPENQMVWNIHWNYQEGNSGYGFSSEVDAVTGDVISASTPGRILQGKDTYYPPEISKEEALKRAKAFVKKAVPSVKTDQLILDEKQFYSDQPLFGPFSYRFRLNSQINGVPVPDQYISVTMDGNGEISRFYKRSNHGEYPSPEPEVSLKQATEKFLNELSVEQVYFTQRNGPNNHEVFLGWQPNTATTYLDAQTNQYLSYDGKFISENNISYQDIPEGESFIPIEPDKGELISAEQAASLVTKYFGIPEAKKLTRKSLSENSYNYDGQMWELVWRAPNSFGFDTESRAEVDAKTGKLVSFREYRHRPINDDEETNKTEELSQEKITKKALTYIRKLYPKASDQLQWRLTNLKTDDEAGRNYSFQFLRVIDGIRVENDGIYMSLDHNGRITNYRLNETPNLKERIKDIESNITKEEAREKFMNNIHVELQYHLFRGEVTPEGTRKTTTKLVYTRKLKDGLNVGFVLDAQSGKWKSRYQSNREENLVMPKDLSDQWAKEQLLTLIKHRVISVDENDMIYPENSITYGEWLQMMAGAVSPSYKNYGNRDDKKYKNITKDNPYFAAVQYALNQEWINENRDEIPVAASLTREALAQSVVHILGYDQLAFFMGDHLNFKDQKDIHAKGAVELISNLGIMQGDNSFFYPDEPVTKAQAAAVMMRMVYLQDKVDHPVGENRY